MQGGFRTEGLGGMEEEFLTEAPASSWGFGREVRRSKKIY